MTIKYTEGGERMKKVAKQPIPEKELGMMKYLPIDNIRPDPNQPRKDFDKKDIHELSLSIKEAGQKVPIKVMHVTEGRSSYYLICDGECRWRACKKAGISKIIAWIGTNKNMETHFDDSLISNFSRKGHTTLEIAWALQTMLGHNGNTIPLIAKKVSKSDDWVKQHLSILRLDPEVQDLMGHHIPPKKRLTFSNALILLPLEKKVQLRLAKKITENSLPFTKVKRLVFEELTMSGAKPKKPKREPRKIYSLISGLFTRTRHTIEHFEHEIPEDSLKKCFRLEI